MTFASQRLAAARRRPVPHRRRHRDLAHLQRRPRAARLRRVRSPEERRRRGGAAPVLPAPTPRIAGALRRRPDSRERHLARERRLGRAPRLHAGASSPTRTGSAIRLLEALPARARGEEPDVVISGCVGPRGDGYVPAQPMSERRGARLPPRRRSRPSPATAADMVTAITMNYAEEAIGIARAAQRRRHAGGDLVHRRDRRPAADRPVAQRGDRAGRRAPRARTRATT